MAKTSPHLDTPLREQVERLSAFESHGLPVVSLYLDLRSDQHGRDNYEVFCRKAFADQLKSFKPHAAERASLERDIENINQYLANNLDRSSDGLAIFSSSGTGEFFEAVQLHAGIDEHWLFIGATPHLYPLVRLIDQYPRYAAVLLDTNHARIFVFALGGIERREEVTGVKTRRTAMGGWSQARYQRHAENFHLHHVKEVVDTLDRVVRADNIQHIIVAGDEVALPLLDDAMPDHLREKIVDTMKFDRQSDENQIARATLELVREKDAETDAERVAAVVGAWHAGGLGVVGPEATMRALEVGQVEELLISATPEALKTVQNLNVDASPRPAAAETSAPSSPDPKQLHLADELVTRAHKTGARVRMIEDRELLRDYGGVGALLRFRL